VRIIRRARRAYSAIQSAPQQAASPIGKPSLAPMNITTASGLEAACRRACACQSSRDGFERPVEMRASLRTRAERMRCFR
jgi:hypothetical protein